MTKRFSLSGDGAGTPEALVMPKRAGVTGAPCMSYEAMKKHLDSLGIRGEVARRILKRLKEECGGNR